MRKVNRWDLITLFLIIILSIGLYLFIKNDNIVSIKRVGFLSILTLIYVIFYTLKVQKKVGLFLYFLIICYCITLGQCTCVFLGVPIESFASFKYGGFSYYDILFAAKFSLLSFILLSFGGNLAFNNNRKNYISYGDKSLLDSNIIKRLKFAMSDTKAIKFVGLILFAISAPFDLYSRIVDAVHSINYGYLSHFINAYEFSVSSDYFGSISLFVLPASFLLMFALNKENSKYKFFPFYYMLFRAFLLLVTGSRGIAFAILLALFYVYQKLYKKEKFKKIKLKHIVFIGVIGYLSAALFLTIFSYRNSMGNSNNSFFYLYIKTLFSGEIISEFLKSLSVEHPLLLVIKNLKNGLYTYKYGLTFLYPLIMILPNFIRGRLYSFGFATGIIAFEGQLTLDANLNYGVGYTIFAESFYNLGIYGSLIMIPLGYILGKILKTSDDSTAIFPLKIVMFIFILLITRSTMQLFYKYIFYYYFVPVLLIYYFHYRFVRLNNKTSNNQTENIISVSY